MDEQISWLDTGHQETQQVENEEKKGTPATSMSGDGPQNTKARKKYPMVIPYIKVFSEQFHKILKECDIPAYFNLKNTLRQLLVHPKEKVVGPVYHIHREDCDVSYVGEMEWSLEARFLKNRHPSTHASLSL